MNTSYHLQLSVVEVKDILLRIAARRRRESVANHDNQPPQTQGVRGGVITRVPVPRSPLSE